LPDDGWIVREFSVDPLARSVTAVRERLDEAARQRDAVERAFAGRAVTQLVVDADRLEIHAGDAHRLVVWGSVNIQPTHRDPWRSVGVSAIPADVLAQLRTVIAEKIISVHARPDTDLMIQIESEFRRAKGVPGFVISAGSLDTPLGRWRLEAPEGAVESLAAPAAERP
jgi:hypothetical protein